MSDTATPNWWMYHGDPAHSGNAASPINRSNTSKLKLLHGLQLGGPILSVPAVADGFVYVGTANSRLSPGSNGGSIHKIDIASGETAGRFTWNILPGERDTHGFTGMGSTPAVHGGRVYFSAFNGKLYCLDAANMQLVWRVDLRNADLEHNQPVSNVLGPQEEPGPVAAGWSSPLLVPETNRLYLGMGEGENPSLYGFVYCIDAGTGDVVWIYCTCPFQGDKPNDPNVLPPDAVTSDVPPGFTVADSTPPIRGCSVWSSPAYDPMTNRIYCATGNPQPEPEWPQPSLPAKGFSNGLLALDAATGAFGGFFQALPESNYRPSDFDVDIGASPTVFSLEGQKVVGIGCKNGGYFTLKADFKGVIKKTKSDQDLSVAPFNQLLRWRQLLPKTNDGRRIPTVDPHSDSGEINPPVSNEESDNTQGENYSGTYSTAAVAPALGRLFIGMGGPNYHTVAPGIDSDSTPFMRALDWRTLEDAWPTTSDPKIDPPRYVNSSPPMYTNPGEAALSSPAVANDVVFCTTAKIAIYAFDAKDGKTLWGADIGSQTQGYNGGYGYCMGPAVWKEYVVAGALVFGRDGGVLDIYKLEE